MYIEFLDESIAWRGHVGWIGLSGSGSDLLPGSPTAEITGKDPAGGKIRNLVRDTELNMLKSQINPHFLFNSLNSIASLTMSNPDEARDMIIRLSDFLRYSLKHSENEYVPLKEELGHMKDYLAIEKVRFGEKLVYEFNIGEECATTFRSPP